MPTSDSLSINNQKGLTPIIIVIVLAIVLAVVSFWIYRNYPYGATKPQEQIACTMEAKLCSDGSSVGRSGPRCEFSPCPTPKEATASARAWNGGTYQGVGYSVNVPAGYQIEENQQYDWVSFNRDTQNSSIGILISREATIETNPCKGSPEPAYPNAKCKTINGYSALDWGSDLPPYPMGPITYIYSFINNSYYFQIQFIDIEKAEKDQILSTFKFTQ
jgi:hypothetical protein